MTVLVGDLLTLARSDSGMIEHVNERFDFRPIAERAIDSVRLIAQSKHITFYISIPIIEQ
ncbi:hypothetical protein [Peribacillus saganii]|uniref:hypothetical protein n=1 Tax=Peribacillus saganii TaxID=2303992 RepID=UPI0013143CC4|nr:hypothetical protein [Peribacillus saganii]